MKSRQALVVAGVVAAVVCGAAGFGYVMLNTFSHMGEQAVAEMNAEEREALQRLGRLHKAMSAAEVYAALGEPTSELFIVAKWNGFGGSRLSQLRVEFYDGHPRRIRWLKLGSFVYEKEL